MAAQRCGFSLGKRHTWSKPAGFLKLGAPPEFPSVAKGSLYLGSCLDKNAAGFTGDWGGGSAAENKRSLDLVTLAHFVT